MQLCAATSIRFFFNGQTIAPGVLSPPVLADSFRRFVQPIRVSQEDDQFDGAKEFHRVGFRLAERPQFALRFFLSFRDSTDGLPAVARLRAKPGGEGRNRTANARFSAKNYNFRRTISI
jgi:hypothetical protein